MVVTKFGRRLLHDTKGQVLLFGAILMVALLAFMLMIPNGTQVATQKMRAQTAADAGAFTGSVWLARSLNLSANMNIGVRSVYTWMTVLTMGSALAQALYTDTLDASVRTLGQDLAHALFNNYDPVIVSGYIYPASIESLVATGQWLQDLQTDVAASFALVGQEIAISEARRNASGGNPLSTNPDGDVRILTNDSIPMLVETAAGDSLMYDDLLEVAGSLDTIPTGDDNIGPATGIIIIDSLTYDIWAYYGSESEWYDVAQYVRYYMDYLEQTFRDTMTGRLDSGHRFFPPGTLGKPPWQNYLQAKTWPTARLPQDSWMTYFDNPDSHFILLKTLPGDNAYKMDTVIMERHYFKKGQPIGPWVYDGKPGSGDSVLAGTQVILDSFGNKVNFDSSRVVPTGFYVGAESTVGHQGTRLRPRRLNPDREFHAVSYVWRLGANTSPRGPGPRYGGRLFSRAGVPAPLPMVTVARSVPYLAMNSPTEEDYFFSPNWDARLTPLDSTAVQDICGGTAYDTLGLDSLNLEELRRYVLLP